MSWQFGLVAYMNDLSCFPVLPYNSHIKSQTAPEVEKLKQAIRSPHELYLSQPLSHLAAVSTHLNQAIFTK